MKRLTPFQEREVSARLGQGLTYEQIATLFGRARGTVNNDFYKIHKALEIRHTCELASRFLEYRKLYPERIRHFIKDVPEKILKQLPENHKAYNSETGEELKIGDRYTFLRLEQQ